MAPHLTAEVAPRRPAPSPRHPARLVVALLVAGVLTVVLVYTAVAGSTRALEPSSLAGHTGTVTLAGRVVGRVSGDARTAAGLRFALHDVDGPGPTVPVVFHGSFPDLFRSGRDVNLTGRLEGATFVATAMTTKCPSKYSATTGSTD